MTNLTTENLVFILLDVFKMIWFDLLF